MYFFENVKSFRRKSTPRTLSVEVKRKRKKGLLLPSERKKKGTDYAIYQGKGVGGQGLPLLFERNRRRKGEMIDC